MQSLRNVLGPCTYLFLSTSLLICACSDNDLKIGVIDAENGSDAQSALSDSGIDTAITGDAATLDSIDGTVATIEPSPACADISAQIVAATGNTIVVSPGEAGTVMLGGNSTTLRQVVLDAKSGDTILLEDGTYTFYAAGTGHGDYTGVYFTKPNITMRSASGNAEAVILDSNYVDHGNSSGVVTINASGVVLAGFTVKRSIYHLVHLWADADQAHLHNLRLEDGGQQFIKASTGGPWVDDITINCSRFVMTDTGRTYVWGYGKPTDDTTCYTGGVDAHNSRNWHVHDNRFEDIYCDTVTPHPVHGLAPSTFIGGLAEHAIHLWDAPSGAGHIVERNQIINCGRGIGIGMDSDVYDTIVRNNTVYSQHAGSSEHDVGINVELGHNIKFYNNTVFYSSPNAYSNAIEYRYRSSNIEIRNNLTNQAIFPRDDATATLSDNIVNAQNSWFSAAASGDLHLVSCSIDTVVGQGMTLDEVNDDIDHEIRGNANDIGADQCTP